MVAEFGIAPNSPRLQRGANLSQLFSLKMVPPRGNAPRSISNRLMALLLSYGGYCHKKSPVKVTHPRLPDVSRARCYYANGRKVCCRPQDHRIRTLTGNTPLQLLGARILDIGFLVKSPNTIGKFSSSKHDRLCAVRYLIDLERKILAVKRILNLSALFIHAFPKTFPDVQPV